MKCRVMTLTVLTGLVMASAAALSQHYDDKVSAKDLYQAIEFARSHDVQPYELRNGSVLIGHVYTRFVRVGLLAQRAFRSGQSEFGVRNVPSEMLRPLTYIAMRFIPEVFRSLESECGAYSVVTSAGSTTAWSTWQRPVWTVAGREAVTRVLMGLGANTSEVAAVAGFRPEALRSGMWVLLNRRPKCPSDGRVAATSAVYLTERDIATWP
jgi:hypothetical protein